MRQHLIARLQDLHHKTMQSYLATDDKNTKRIADLIEIVIMLAVIMEERVEQ